MRSKEEIAREILTEQLLKDFKSEITGEHQERVVNINPEDAFFVGKLMSINDDDSKNKVFSSKTFIESISIDFYVSQANVNDAEVTIYPQGEFFYRVYPTLDEQRQAIVKKVYEITNERFKSYNELRDEYKLNPSKFDNTEIKLIPVYKKMSLSERHYPIIVKLGEILKEDSTYGFVDENHALNKVLAEYIEQIMSDIQQEEDFYTFVVNEKTKISDLDCEDTYEKFINNNVKKDVKINQNWSIYTEISVKKIKNQYLISVSLVNNSQIFSNTSNKKGKDKKTIETLFNSGLKICLKNADFEDIEMDYFADDYKYDRTQKAIGTNCTIKYDKEDNSIVTEHTPVYIQHRFVTRDDLAVKFEELCANPEKVLKQIEKLMYAELQEWKDYKQKKQDTLTEKGKKSLSDEIAEFSLEIQRFQKGIKTIEDFPIVKKSFIYMNETFKNTNSKYNTWRLFQIVFIVSIIPDIVACDDNLMSYEEKISTTLDSMALLYFPTGGGKTEAFLGVLVFNLFFDRYRGKKVGVTSILRYPLRLLSVQQVQRLANVLAQAELIRRTDSDICKSSEFSLGYFVGDSNTPNKLTLSDIEKYRTKTQEQKDEDRIIDVCPFCKNETVHLDVDEDTHRLIHFCDNPNCTSGQTLPIYIVDSEIYRYLPSAIISTVDKLAIMGNNRNFRSIINGANCKCPKHGYTTTDRCVEYNVCKVESTEFIQEEMYDPAPTLLIQDELHLINESLGAYASHYESFLHYFIKKLSKSKRGVKVIGATATISSYRSQVYHLYNKEAIRFPAASPYVDRNFYAYTDTKDIQRRIMGYSPFGKAIVNSVVYSLKYMRRVVYKYLQNPQNILNIPGITIDNIETAKKILEDYWIFLEYNNVKRDSNNVEGALETPINVELESEGIKPFITRKMTGDESFQDVRNVLAEVETSTNVYEGINLISATSMISHGVDADRFNIMFFYGIPGNMAEYIQAYSRTGRKYSSIVIDIIRPARETDQSYLKNFEKIHEFKDIMIEAVAINRWASKAIDHTLPGVFASILLNQYDQELQFTIGSLFFMKNLKQVILNNCIPQNEICTMLYESYGCTDSAGVVDLGNQYRLKIDNFLNNVYEQIVDKNWTEENIFTGFGMMGYRIMNSLRDTDIPLIIELES